MFCKHWREIDDNSGMTEWCGAREFSCACSGQKRQCRYLDYFNASKQKVIWLRSRESFLRAEAAVEPFKEVTKCNRKV
jgi:hypothetical protein